MAKIDDYRKYVKQILNEYGEHKPAYGDVEVEVCFDTERERYQVIHTGWSKQRRVYGCVIHIDIKDGKIWIQHDGTEVGIADELVALGVPKQDIVLAYHSPYMRKFTEFAVG